MNIEYAHTPSRRKFIKQSATLLGSSLVVPQILAQSAKGANERLNIAWVGVGAQGGKDLRSCSGGNNIVAICDTDGKRLGNLRNDKSDTKYYTDFRRMFAEVGDKIDAVGVGTPDHNHFAVTYMAMQMGKHVFVQKPLTHSLWEARTLQALAVEKDLTTQMGNQGHAYEGARLIKEWYEAGLIGEVREVHVWTDRPNRGYGFSGNVQTSFPAADPMPEGMDWDNWLGPVTKEVPFSKELHPISWRPWWDFGCGGLGDIGCHAIDTAFWALGLGAPERVEVEMAGAVNPIYTPNGSVVTYHFPARGEKPPVKLKWYEGPRRPEYPEGIDRELSRKLRNGGLIMAGENGGIIHSGMRPNSPMLYPEARWNEYRTNRAQQVPKTLPRVKGGIHEDWIESIKQGKKACSDFSYSGPLTEIILLGTLAIRTGKGFEWDAENLRIQGNDEAAGLIQVEARKGWRTEDLT